MYPQRKAVTISMSKTITICLLYLPPSENLNIVLLTRLIAQLPTPFVICGDFNGHSVTWCCDKNNSRRDRIDDLITDNNVCLLNDGSYTYLHPATGTFTTIDLSMCSPDILMEIDFMVELDSYGSDNFPIVLKIDISLSDLLPRWNFSRADWVKFDQLCKVNLTLDTIELYEEPIVLFTDILCSIAKSCMPRTTAKQKKRKPWFNTECKDAMKARKSALVRFKTNITTDNLNSLFRYYKLFTQPTRIIMNQSNIKSATLIDNIYTNSTDWKNGLRGILHSDEIIGNDLKSIFAILPTFSALKSPQFRTQRDFSIKKYKQTKKSI